MHLPKYPEPWDSPGVIFHFLLQIQSFHSSIIVILSSSFYHLHFNMSSPNMSSKSRIPGTPKQWETRATELLVSDVPLSQLNKLDSASKMTEQQFLCLRVLWPGSKQPNEFPKPSETTKARIDEVMANFPPFDAYLDHLRTPEKEYFDRKMGVMLVMQAQRHVAMDRKTIGLDYDSVAIRRSARVQN